MNVSASQSDRYNDVSSRLLSRSFWPALQSDKRCIAGLPCHVYRWNVFLQEPDSSVRCLYGFSVDSHLLMYDIRIVYLAGQKVRYVAAGHGEFVSCLTPHREKQDW